MRRLVLALAAAAAALVVAALASAGEVKLDWREQIKDGRGHVVMTFRVHGLVFDKTGWAAAITFRNVAQRTVRITPDFGLALYRTSKPGGPPDRFLAVSRARPTMPGALAPGGRWTGAIGGAGKPPAGMYVRVVFGHFAGLAIRGFPSGFIWITDHAYRMPRASGPVA
jgi:hypothetical protein